MKKKIISIFITAAMSVSMAAGAFAAEDGADAVNAEVYTSMSEAEKTEYINDNLSVRLQHLSRLVSISSNQALDKMAGEVKAALDDGLTAVEIKEAIYHSGAYCGFTRAAAALDAADEALKALGQDIPYESRITSTEETRYDDGLAVQRFLFGAKRPTIGAVTDDMEESLKLQTLFLSGICFGDFYNRVGLPVYEREFLTLCTIAGNDNCQAQFSSHTGGNLDVGHSKDMLRAAMLCNEDVNGEEKTAIAIDVINANTTELNENPTPERPQPTEAITADYASDSEELLSLMEHFKTDDKENYVGRNIDNATQDILIAATEAVINGTEIPASENKATQVLIDLAVMGAQGGRESELAGKISEGYAAGLTKDNMLAVPLLTAPYNGFPRTLNMRNALSAEIDAAAETAKTTVTMQIGSPVMTINGTQQNIDTEGTAPVVIDNRTLLPVRAFVEAIGGEVAWDDNTYTAALKYDGKEILLTIGSTTAYLDNEANTLDVTPVIINNRTMLPIGFIAESFGFMVEWENSTQTVIITDNTNDEK
ncbi:MAG: stalk domain-containing protein [bacterium]|nr:stalk domain-containing protein [bacterium]